MTLKTPRGSRARRVGGKKGRLGEKIDLGGVQGILRRGELSMVMRGADYRVRRKKKISKSPPPEKWKERHGEVPSLLSRGRGTGLIQESLSSIPRRWAIRGRRGGDKRTRSKIDYHWTHGFSGRRTRKVSRKGKKKKGGTDTEPLGKGAGPGTRAEEIIRE